MLVNRLNGPTQDACWITRDTKNHQATFFREGVHVVALVHFLFSWYIMCRIYCFSKTLSNDQRAQILARKGLMHASSVKIIHVPYLVWQLVQGYPVVIPLGGF